MINDQDKRAIETMAQCGCELDSLCAMFPKVQREDIITIWKNVMNDSGETDNSDSGNISINCS